MSDDNTTNNASTTVVVDTAAVSPTTSDAVLANIINNGAPAATDIISDVMSTQNAIAIEPQPTTVTVDVPTTDTAAAVVDTITEMATVTIPSVISDVIAAAKQSYLEKHDIALAALDAFHAARTDAEAASAQVHKLVQQARVELINVENEVYKLLPKISKELTKAKEFVTDLEERVAPVIKDIETEAEKIVLPLWRRFVNFFLK